MCIVLPLNYIGVIGGVMLGVVSFPFLSTKFARSIKMRFKKEKEVRRVNDI